MRYSFILAVFGFILSRAGATTYDYYAKLFLFQDLQLMWVIGVAATVGAVGVAILKKTRAKTLVGHETIEFVGKPWKKGLLPGSLLFGAGWGLAGACPGTALAMLGEGKLMAGFSIVGILLGVYLHGVIHGDKPADNPAAGDDGEESAAAGGSTLQSA
jgi:uncharacterized membrane protein YedE/YeeE